ncbi:MAG: M20 aminoacylase family protein [Pseudomonadota bacterium]|jgi:hippurate hydrolase
MNLIPGIQERCEKLVRIRRDIHAHPELAYQEHRTADLVARHLAECGIEVHRGFGRTGVVGVLKAGEGPGMIGLRADMDALPLQERNTFAHRSTIDGRMHGCGHDGHTAMLLGAAEYLAATRNFDGTVVFVFQPAEEGEGGGRAMIEDGLFRRFPVDQVFGLHNWPGIAVGQMAVMAGPVMASADRFEIVLTGKGGHAAMPHQTADSIVAASHLVQALQTIASRTLHPLDAVVVSVTQFHAGDAYNVIPAETVLRGTVRAFRAEVQDKIEQTMRRLCAGVGDAYGVSVSLRFERGYPPTVNDAEAAAVCRAVAGEVLGADNVLTGLQPTMGAEDFAYMLQEKPGCYVWLGNGPGEGGCTLHSPVFDFNDDIIPIGVSYWVRLVEHQLRKG